MKTLKFDFGNDFLKFSYYVTAMNNSFNFKINKAVILQMFEFGQKLDDETIDFMIEEFIEDAKNCLKKDGSEGKQIMQKYFCSLPEIPAFEFSAISPEGNRVQAIRMIETIGSGLGYDGCEWDGPEKLPCFRINLFKDIIAISTM